MNVSFPDRRFAVWQFSVGMGRLLLRSVKTDAFTTQVDIYFQDVDFLRLHTSLDGVEIRVANAEERIDLESSERLNLEDGDLEVFIITSTDRIGVVVAGVVKAQEDERDHDEPSVLW
jgi:hypothetical protein